MATRNQSLAALTQANNLLTQQMAALQQQIQQLLQAQQQAQQPPVPPVAPLVGPGVAAAHNRAQTNNGVAGYEGERPLTVEELAYVALLMGLGINQAAAHELFRHGYNEVKGWKKIKPASIGHLVTNVTKNKSHYCLPSDPVFYGHSFGDRISIIADWIHHQESIGSPVTSVIWNQTPNAEEVNEQRMNYMAEKKTNKNTDRILSPDKLTKMKLIAPFEESLMAHLSIKRGKTGVPLAYVLLKEVAVTDEQRPGAVGPGQTYEHWDEYLVACTVHQGEHWVADNTSVYHILTALIRDGPGWHYINPSSHKKCDGRALWLRLLEKAYDSSNVDRICNERRLFYSTMTYNGPTRHMDFDQYCTKWYTNNRILAYHDRLPPQRDIVSDFIRSLDPTNNLVFHTAAMQVRQSPTKREDFDAAVDTFKNAIGDSPLANNNKKRNVSEVNGGAPGGRETTDVNGRDYSKSTKKFIPNGEWRRMSPKQQDDFNCFRANEASFHPDRGLCQLVHSQSQSRHVSFQEGESNPRPQENSSPGDSYLYSLSNRNITETAIEEDFNLLPRLLSALTVGDNDAEEEAECSFPRRTVSAFYTPCISGYYKSRDELLDNLIPDFPTEEPTEKMSASTIPSAAGRTGFEIVHGYTPDITLYMLHEWYDPVYWYNSRQGDQQKYLGRWLGPCGDIFGGGDCFYVLTKSGKIHVTNTVIAVAEEDWNNPDFLTNLDGLNKDIESRIGDKVKAKDSENLEEVPPDIFDDDLIDIAVRDDPNIGNSPIVDADNVPDGDTYDEYLHTKVMMQVGDSRLSCKVKERVVDLNGNPIGQRNNNPLLDSRAYHCEFPDGSTETFTANLLAENLMSSVDDDGHAFQLFSEILGHEKDESVALTEKEATYITKSGQKRNRPMTKGWLLRIQWKDGSSGHVKLSDMKDSFPYQTAVYARDKGLIDEPAFRWWAYHVLRRKKLAISALKNRGKYWDRTHKYGVELPKTIKHARAIYKRTNTDYWEKAIQKEMTNNLISFEFTENDDDSFTRDPEYQQISVHMVFDVKLTGLVRKARLCADGHKARY